MADTQDMTQTIIKAAIEATKAAVKVMVVTRAEAGTEPRSKSVNMRSKLGGPTLKQCTFDWSATDKYIELRKFRIEVNKTKFLKFLEFLIHA